MRLDDPRATLLNQPKESGPGHLSVLCGDAARFSLFWTDLLPLTNTLPLGSSVRVHMGSDITVARNASVADLLEADPETAGWIVFLDDDHAFQPDLIYRLLARDVPIVQPVCLRRQQPFLSVATGLDGNFLRFADLEPDGLVEVMFAGSSGMLIRREVLEAIEPPWFSLEDGISEDVNFCRKAAAAGFKIHVDMAVRLGHTTVATIWPNWDEEREQWMTGFTVADGAQLKIGVIAPEPLPEETPA